MAIEARGWLHVSSFVILYLIFGTSWPALSWGLVSLTEYLSFTWARHMLLPCYFILCVLVNVNLSSQCLYGKVFYDWTISSASWLLKWLVWITMIVLLDFFFSLLNLIVFQCTSGMHHTHSFCRLCSYALRLVSFLFVLAFSVKGQMGNNLEWEALVWSLLCCCVTEVNRYI